jgi:hypothetical protein
VNTCDNASMVVHSVVSNAEACRSIYSTCGSAVAVLDVTVALYSSLLTTRMPASSAARSFLRLSARVCSVSSTSTVLIRVEVCTTGSSSSSSWFSSQQNSTSIQSKLIQVQSHEPAV